MWATKNKVCFSPKIEQSLSNHGQLSERLQSQVWLTQPQQVSNWVKEGGWQHSQRSSARELTGWCQRHTKGGRWEMQEGTKSRRKRRTQKLKPPNCFCLWIWAVLSAFTIPTSGCLWSMPSPTSCGPGRQQRWVPATHWGDQPASSCYRRPLEVNQQVGALSHPLSLLLKYSF